MYLCWDAPSYVDANSYTLVGKYSCTLVGIHLLGCTCWDPPPYHYLSSPLHPCWGITCPWRSTERFSCRPAERFPALFHVVMWVWRERRGWQRRRRGGVWCVPVFPEGTQQERGRAAAFVSKRRRFEGVPATGAAVDGGEDVCMSACDCIPVQSSPMYCRVKGYRIVSFSGFMY